MKILSLLFTFLLKVLCFLLFASLFIFNSYHNFHTYDITRLLDRGEICEANFIPPANGASLGSYLSKNGCFWAKTGKIGPIIALAPKPATIF